MLKVTRIYNLNQSEYNWYTCNDSVRLRKLTHYQLLLNLVDKIMQSVYDRCRL